MEHTFSVLRDLEVKYLELLGAKEWDGIGHDASAFKAGLSKDVQDSYDEARALAVSRGERVLPFSEWVKTATCHQCGEIGHIKPQCPKTLKNGGKAGGSRRPLKTNRRWKPGDKPHRGKKDRQAFKQALNALADAFGVDSSDESEAEAEADLINLNYASDDESEGETHEVNFSGILSDSKE